MQVGEKVWMKEVYSKAVKKSIEDGCTAFTRAVI